MKLRKRCFCARLYRGRKIVLTWFDECDDAVLHYNKVKLGHVRNLGLSPLFRTYEEGEAFIQREWGKLPVFHVEGKADLQKVADIGAGTDLRKMSEAREDLTRLLFAESRNQQPFPVEKICHYCNWTNTGLLNIGKPNEPKWICHSCVQRVVAIADGRQEVEANANATSTP